VSKTKLVPVGDQRRYELCMQQSPAQHHRFKPDSRAHTRV
jgi:hypothetical protein